MANPVEISLQVPIPGLPEKITLCRPVSDSLVCDGLATYIGAAYNWLIVAGAIFCVVIIMIGGLQYLTAGGGGKVQEAQKRIKDALFGLVLLLGSYLILYLINPSLTNLPELKLGVVKKVAVEFISSENTGSDFTALDQASSSGTGTNGVPLFKQWDARWGNTQYGSCSGRSTIASSGCGPTSAAMVLSFYGKPTTPAEMAEAFARNGFRACGNGTAYGAFTTSTVLGPLGFKGEAIAKEDILQHLRSNHPIIVTVGPSIFTKGGHFIVLTGVDSSGNILVNDPNKSSYAGLGATSSIPANYIIPNIYGAFYLHK